MVIRETYLSRIRPFIGKDIIKVLTGIRRGGKSVLFEQIRDEIQEVEGWEKAINSPRVKFNADIYNTGSNSRLLSGELATYIAGRYVSFIVYPFSFTEFISVNSDYTLDDYLKYGGMPFLCRPFRAYTRICYGKRGKEFFGNQYFKVLEH